MTSSPSDKQRQPTPKAELFCGFLGLIIVSAAIGYLIYAGASGNGPPALQAQVTKVSKQEHAYLVEVTVRNSGGHTAQDGVLQASLFPMQADNTTEPVEQQQLRFDYIPPSSTRDGGILFENDPSRYTLQLRFLSYTQP